MSKRDRVAGETTSERLLERMEGGLSRQSMVNGGAVYRGPLASRALQAVGARAMTVDRSIVVGDGFDASSSEGQALYAHEQVHAKGSGGDAGHSIRDAEEIAARAAEAMVFHRAQAEQEAGYADAPERGVEMQGGELFGMQASGTQKVGKPKTEHPAERGYNALHEQGLTHTDIVHRLAEKVLEGMDEQHLALRERHHDTKGSF